MSIVIKSISKAESRLVIDLFNKYRIFYKQPSDLELAETFITARLENNESVIFVALTKEGDEMLPVGFTQLYPKFSSGRAIKIWILNDLYVEADYRKQGIGEKLINTVLEFAKKDGASNVELSTAVDNYTAQKLYENIGFKTQPASSTFLNYSIDIQ